MWLRVERVNVNLKIYFFQPNKKSDWRRKHEEFVKTIRAARGATAAIKQGKEPPPPPEPTYNPDYIQCQYCNRRFNETAAERHINFCKEQKARMPKQSSDTKYDVKKEKQQKRTQVTHEVSCGLADSCGIVFKYCF